MSWETVPLTDVLEFREGPGILAKDFHDEGIPLIRLAGLKKDASQLEGCNYLDPDLVAKKWAHFQVRRGDVLLSTSASLGEVAEVGEEAVGAVPYTGIIAFRSRDPRVEQSFIRFMLTAPDFKAQIEAMGVGSVMKHFGPSHLRFMTVGLPPLADQQGIAEVLGALDDKIAANLSLSRTIGRYLAAVFVEITMGAGHTALGEVATVNGRVVRPKESGYLRYVDISSVGDGEIAWPDRISWEDAPARARRGLSEGDTIWSTVRPNRRSHALSLSNDSELVASTGLAVISPRSCGFAFLYQATDTPDFSGYLENVAEGSAYPAVKAERFLAAPIPWPVEDVRNGFEAIASPMRRQQYALDVENRTLAATRNALLPQLMSGKLRVEDAEKVVAAAV